MNFVTAVTSLVAAVMFHPGVPIEFFHLESSIVVGPCVNHDEGTPAERGLCHDAGGV